MTETQSKVGQAGAGMLAPAAVGGYDMRAVTGRRYVALCQTCGVVSSPMSEGSASMFAMAHHGVTGWHKAAAAPAD